MDRITIAVPTFRRRDQLVDLLPELLGQCDDRQARHHEVIRVLIIDNDPQASAGWVVELGEPRVEYLCEPRPGVVAVRNRALAEAEQETALIFLDDDQHPAPGWLQSMIDTWRSTAAAAVAGPVRSQLPESTDRWIRAGGFFDRSYRDALQTGDLLPEVATTNLLLDMDFVQRLGLRFDEAFALSGGEDSLFTRRLSRAGGRIVWSVEALVYEPVPAERLTRPWVCRRALSSGNAMARVRLRLAGRSAPLIRVGLLAIGMIRLVGGTAGVAYGIVTGSLARRARSTRTVFRGAGILLGALGISYLEYGRGRRWSVREGHHAVAQA